MQVTKKYLLYLIRWQLSTPILALCVIWFAAFGEIWSTIIANFIGGLIFFWIDRWIFRKTDILRGELWESVSSVACADCGKVERGLRLVKTKGYDKSGDRRPEFRCRECSALKYKRDWKMEDGR
jgi:hypothetical protein